MEMRESTRACLLDENKGKRKETEMTSRLFARDACDRLFVVEELPNVINRPTRNPNIRERPFEKSRPLART